MALVKSVVTLFINFISLNNLQIILKIIISFLKKTHSKGIFLGVARWGSIARGMEGSS